MFYKLDKNDDGNYFICKSDEALITNIYCDGTYGEPCEEPFIGSFVVE